MFPFRILIMDIMKKKHKPIISIMTTRHRVHHPYEYEHVPGPKIVEHQFSYPTILITSFPPLTN